MNWDAWKPLATLIFTSLLKFAGGLLVAHGLATNGPGLEALGGAATTAAGAFWSWWVQKGHVQAGDYLKKLTDTATQAAAIEVAKRMPVTGAAVAAKKEATAIEPAVMAKDAAKAASAIVAIVVLAAFAFTGNAHAQGRHIAVPDPLQQFNDKIKTDLGQAKAAVTGQPAPPSTAALPCMDITMLPKLTPFNLIPTMKACVQDVNNQLVTDTQRALDSAKAFAGSATGSGTSTVIGDNDAINCLTPALALFKAAAIVPAVPDTPAVLNADGTVKTAAVPGTPELDPGPILLGQKFREFTLAGGLTSCQNWVNEPIQAVTAAGVAGIGTVVAGAAIAIPKP